MRVAIDNHGVRIGPAPLTIVADGSTWDARQAELVACIGVIAKRAGASSSTTFWSLGESFDGTPPLATAQERKLAQRGRYVTPLVEGGRLGPSSDNGPVVCLVSGPVPDWADWSGELAVRFPNLVAVRTEPDAARLDGADDLDARDLTVSQTENALSPMLFTERVVGIRLEFGSALPTDVPAGFRATRSADGLAFVWSGDATSVDVPLSLAGGRAEADLSVVVELASGSSMQSVGSLATAVPDELRWHAIAPEHSASFLEAVGEYARGSSRHQCGICGEPHEFVRALRCDRHPASFLDEEVVLAVSLVPHVAPGDRVVVCRREDSLRAACAGAGPVVWLGRDVLVRADDAWLLFDEGGEYAAGLDQTFPGLAANEERGVWLVEV